MNKTIAELMASKKALEASLKAAITTWEAENNIRINEYIEIQRQFTPNNQGVEAPISPVDFNAQPIERVRLSIRMPDINQD